MSEKDLFVGMLFKVEEDPSIVGVCTKIENDRFYYHWKYYNGELSSFHELSIKQAVRCFQYYGWQELSSLEKELV
jgi:hypothetical protein